MTEKRNVAQMTRRQVLNGVGALLAVKMVGCGDSTSDGGGNADGRTGPGREGTDGGTASSAYEPLPTAPLDEWKYDPSSFIEKNAAEMSPGEWRALPSTVDGRPFDSSVFDVYPGPNNTPSQGAIEGLGWTDMLVYYKGTITVPLMRERLDAMARMDLEGAWHRTEDVIFNPERPRAGNRRPFNRWCDGHDGFIYHLPTYETERRTQTGKLARTPIDNPGTFTLVGESMNDNQMNQSGDVALSYAPPWERFLANTTGGKIYTRARSGGPWRLHGRTGSSGVAGVIIYNPLRDEVMAGGGITTNDTTGEHFAYLSGPDADAVRLPPFVDEAGNTLVYTAASRRLTVNPATGEYLLYSHEDWTIFRGDGRGPWKVYEKFDKRGGPLGTYGYYCPVEPLYKYKTLLWLSNDRGLVLHKVKEA